MAGQKIVSLVVKNGVIPELETNNICVGTYIQFNIESHPRLYTYSIDFKIWGRTGINRRGSENPYYLIGFTESVDSDKIVLYRIIPQDEVRALDFIDISDTEKKKAEFIPEPQQIKNVAED